MCRGYLVWFLAWKERKQILEMIGRRSERERERDVTKKNNVKRI